MAVEKVARCDREAVMSPIIGTHYARGKEETGTGHDGKRQGRNMLG